jgi:enterochelin esterase family protein
MRHFVTALAMYGACMPLPCFANSQLVSADRGKPASVPTTPFSPVPVSPTIAENGRVTFCLAAPQASLVEVRGSFPDPFRPTTVAMQKDANGKWCGTTGPLDPEMYSYNFYIDGVPALDPGNSHSKRDAASITSTFIVPGPVSDLYAVKQVPHGTISQIWYDSPKLGKARRTLVYTPPGYESGSMKYPVRC